MLDCEIHIVEGVFSQAHARLHWSMPGVHATVSWLMRDEQVFILWLHTPTPWKERSFSCRGLEPQSEAVNRICHGSYLIPQPACWQSPNTPLRYAKRVAAQEAKIPKEKKASVLAIAGTQHSSWDPSVCLGSKPLRSIPMQSCRQKSERHAIVRCRMRKGARGSNHLVDLAISHCKTASRFVSSFALMP